MHIVSDIMIQQQQQLCVSDRQWCIIIIVRILQKASHGVSDIHHSYFLCDGKGKSEQSCGLFWRDHLNGKNWLKGKCCILQRAVAFKTEVGLLFTDDNGMSRTCMTSLTCHHLLGCTLEFPRIMNIILVISESSSDYLLSVIANNDFH